jgi:xylulose-5-phosphate/fructose-6-phosphate phosphoketolase
MNEQFSTEAIKKYVRAANYLSAAQIYLQDNFLLKEPLRPEHIKPRLLGHWGSCPGINFVYAQLNALIVREHANLMFVLGPGHGFPALQANLFLEGSLLERYPEVTATESGIGHIAKNFSWPYGFPSHSSPGAPGVILEGGELGYALSTSYGSVLDSPDLITVCLIGDGEAETGPTATAWHLNKFISPKTNGAVLPILHLNGYKISGPTIFGRMSNDELIALFTGYGYHPYVVEGDSDGAYQDMSDTLASCYREIRAIQHDAREGSGVVSPHFPMIIMKTPKGWTGIKELHGEKIEGNCLSHQVVALNAKTDPEELARVEEWLRSYRFDELFSEEGGFTADIASLMPEAGMRMGGEKHACGGSCTIESLALPAIEGFVPPVGVPGKANASSMKAIGQYLAEVFALNKATNNFRLMSPDETYSNKLDDVFRETQRAFVWPIMSWDKDMSQDGRVMEMLSEHSLQGLLQGYVLTGRHGVFASYEAFIQVVSSMVDQYAKFLKVSIETPWRSSVPSLNYLLTSSSWRQDHNGFSHQNPGFLSDMLQRHGEFIHVYFPPDAFSALAVLKRCLDSRDEINIIVSGKTPEPQWLSQELALRQVDHGVMIWDFASDPNPDIVLVAAGDYLIKEALAAISFAKKENPDVNIRFVNVLELSSLGIGGTDCSPTTHTCEEYFTFDKPVIFNFHGYPEAVKNILFDNLKGGETGRYSVHGYIESGSTTTPFDMHIRNHTSRYHLVMEIFETLAKRGVVSLNQADDVKTRYMKKLEDHRAYIIEYGVDPEEIDAWQWSA